MASSAAVASLWQRELADPMIAHLDSVVLRPRVSDDPAGELPLVRSADGGALTEWLTDHYEDVSRLLEQKHAVLFRGFEPVDADGLERVSRQLGRTAVDYRYGVSPREKLSAGVYTSTELDARLTLPLHNELSYARRWPRRILFACVQPAEQGGATPIGDVRGVYRDIDPTVRSEFERRGIMYVRNFGTEFSKGDVSWMQAFETEDPHAVELFCTESQIDWEWRPDGGLRTRKATPATRVHPETGEKLWFNQLHLFHSSAIDPAVRRGMLARAGAEGLPRNALFGDGERIPMALVDEVRRAYDRNTRSFDWERGDVLVLDNMIYAHGRMPFTGSRRVLAAMTDPHEGG